MIPLSIRVKMPFNSHELNGVLNLLIIFLMYNRRIKIVNAPQ
jgi:hypothetical protein